MIQRPITSYHSGWRKAKDRIFFWLVCLFSALTAVPLVVIIWEVVRKGYKQINLNFFTETAPSTLDAMLAKINGEIIPGGIANGITGTLLMVVLASVIAIPTGIMGGIYLSEKPKTLFSHVIRFLTDLLQGTPSIVIGIIAYAWVVVPLSSYSALAGSVALAIMMLPLIIRSTEETLKLLPTSLKEAGLALGASYTSVILKGRSTASGRRMSAGRWWPGRSRQVSQKAKEQHDRTGNQRRAGRAAHQRLRLLRREHQAGGAGL